MKTVERDYKTHRSEIGERQTGHSDVHATARIHPSAMIEDSVMIGERSSIWDNVHIRFGTKIGSNCIVGEKTYIAYGVEIGNFVKINANVYICTAVTIDDFCMISAHTVFTNDKFPRAGNVELTGLEISEPTEETLKIYVRRGVTIGANATIGPGIILGDYSMVGMGAVVTKDISPHQLVVGNPARFRAWVCICGHVLEIREGQTAECSRCHREFVLQATKLKLLRDI